MYVQSQMCISLQTVLQLQPLFSNVRHFNSLRSCWIKSSQTYIYIYLFSQSFSCTCCSQIVIISLVSTELDFTLHTLWDRIFHTSVIFRLLTDFVCLYTYEFWLSLCKIVQSSIILLLPLLLEITLFAKNHQENISIFLFNSQVFPLHGKGWTLHSNIV